MEKKLAWMLHCLDAALSAALGTDAQKVPDTEVARLKLHLSVMLLTFERDMSFHLLIFFKS